MNALFRSRLLPRQGQIGERSPLHSCAKCGEGNAGTDGTFTNFNLPKNLETFRLSPMFPEMLQYLQQLHPEDR